MTAAKKSILLVDDDKDGREVLTLLFENKGYKVTACETLEDCLREARKKNFSAIVLDNYFKNGDSYAVCREIRSFNPKTPILFYSGEARKEEIEKAFAAGATEYLVKPLGIIELPNVVDKLLSEREFLD